MEQMAETVKKRRETKAKNTKDLRTETISKLKKQEGILQQRI